jgi:hypothetical protein
MDKNVVFLLLVIAALVLVSDYLTKRGEEARIKGLLEDAYELANPGSSVTEMTLVREGGVYKVIFKFDGDLMEVYVDKEGRYIFPVKTDLGSAMDSLEYQRNFFSCLARKGVVLYGQLGTNETDMQLREFWSSPYLNYIYFDCSGDQLEICLNSNVTEVPSWSINNTLYIGFATVGFIGEVTSCP